MGILQRVRDAPEALWRIPLTLGLLVCIIIVHVLLPNSPEWHVMLWYSAILIVTAQVSRNALEFFLGEGPGLWSTLDYFVRGKPLPQVTVSNVDADELQRQRTEVGFWTLMPSAFITWIFAKSINNSANYGTRWGVLGGFTYSGWYFSFFAAAVVGYVLRTRFGYKSLPEAVEKCYGPYAALGFGICLFYRLWNEVWSNTFVVASFYGPIYSPSWWAAAWVSAIAPAIYVIMGGMRSSLTSDVFQAFLGVVFLVVILAIFQSLAPAGTSIASYTPEGGWAPDWWGTYLAATLQGWVSYPFHDPVLTDRTFLSRPRVMGISFIVGGVCSMAFIILFSLVGVFAVFLSGGQLGAGAGESPTYVAQNLDQASFIFINLVMMTSSMSTLDSTYTSLGKLSALELGGYLGLPGDTRGVRRPLRPGDLEHVSTAHLALARLTIVAMVVAGTVYLYIERRVINATTVSGTVVMGLGPPIWLLLFWKYNSAPGKADGWRKAPLAFVLSLLVGWFFGLAYSFAALPPDFNTGEPRVPGAKEFIAPFSVAGSVFLGWNLLGHVCCFAACALGFFINQHFWQFEHLDAVPFVEDPVTGEAVPRPGYEAAAKAAAQAAAKQAP